MKFSTERPYLWLFAILAVVGFCADQASKYAVFAHLYSEEIAGAPPVIVIPGAFHLRANYVHVKADGAPYLERDPGDRPLSRLATISGVCLPTVNRGALFGMGNGDSESGGMNTFFAVVSLLAACFIIFWVARPTVARDRWLCIALGLILAGTLGNLYDRVVFTGVRDFLHCYYDTHIWPDFNIADCCLVCGAGALLAHSFFVKDPAAEPTQTAPIAAEATPLQSTSPTPSA